jgi:predicted esterase
LIPIYIVHGTEDEILPYKYTAEFEKKLKEAGNKGRLYTIEGGLHSITHENPEHIKICKKMIDEVLEENRLLD